MKIFLTLVVLFFVLHLWAALDQFGVQDLCPGEKHSSFLAACSVNIWCHRIPWETRVAEARREVEEKPTSRAHLPLPRSGATHPALKLSEEKKVSPTCPYISLALLASSCPVIPLFFIRFHMWLQWPRPKETGGENRKGKVRIKNRRCNIFVMGPA